MGLRSCCLDIPETMTVNGTNSFIWFLCCVCVCTCHFVKVHLNLAMYFLSETFCLSTSDYRYTIFAILRVMGPEQNIEEKVIQLQKNVNVLVCILANEVLCVLLCSGRFSFSLLYICKSPTKYTRWPANRVTRLTVSLLLL